MDNLIIETIRSAEEYIRRIVDHLPNIIDQYRKNNIQEAAGGMIDLAEGLQWLQDALRLTSSRHRIDYSMLSSLYQECLEALENRDYVLLSDILEYELIPSLENIQSKIEKTILDSLN